MTRGVEVEELTPVPPAHRARLLERFGNLEVHTEALADIPALQEIELRPAPSPEPLSGPVRVAAWNAERGTYLDEGVELLRGIGADINLLTELDIGMARSGQRHTAREIAAGLGHGYAYAVEFVELGVGGRAERATLGDDAENVAGFHGAAITAATQLRRPVVMRFDTSGVWFTGQRPEPRVGGRMAIAATVSWENGAGGELVVAAVHLESHDDPAARARQVELLLGELDAYAGRRSVVLGGDFNTFSAAAIEIYRSAFRERLLEDDPARFADPVRYEPLFEVAAGRGYGWTDANATGATQRTKADGYPKPPLMRLDWIFVRGVRPNEPATVPAVGRDGTAISDHDLVTVTLT